MNYAAEQFMGAKASNGKVAYYDSGSVKGQMTASGVVDFLNLGISNITAKNRVARKTLISQSLERLRKLQEDAIANENKIYKELDVADLKALQGKINEINESGLPNLSAQALNRMPLIKAAAKGNISPKKLEQGLRDAIRQYMGTEEGRKQIQATIDEVVHELGSDAIVRHNKNLSGNTGRITLHFQEDVWANSSKRAQIIAIFNKRLKPEMKDSDGTITGISVDGNTVNKNFQTNNWILTSDNYPYYPWGTDKQYLLKVKEDAEAAEVWEQFKRNISSCEPRFASTIEAQMEAMGVKAFALTATDAANIKGVLGELYALTVFALLGLPLRYVGNELTEGSDKKPKKIGVDAVFDSMGIQVKNYTPYGGTVEGTHGIHLGDKMTLGGFLEKIGKEGNIEEKDLEAIGLFYAVTAYHLTATPLYESIFERYGGIEKKLKSLYATQIDQFMPLHEIGWNDSQLEKEVSAKNVFYFIGAGDIVPVSLILGVYIKFLEALEKEIRYTNTFTVKLTGEYSGQTYLNYWEALTNRKDGTNEHLDYDFQGYNNIVSALKVKTNINLNLPYTIKQMLGKVLES